MGAARRVTVTDVSEVAGAFWDCAGDFFRPGSDAYAPLGHLAVDDHVAADVDGGIHPGLGPDLIGEQCPSKRTSNVVYRSLIN